MNFPAPERPAPPTSSQAELDRFGRQAAAILALTLMLSGVSYTILIQVLL